MQNISLKFHFQGGLSTTFTNLDDEVVKNIYIQLEDTRKQTLLIGSQWMNKNEIITVYREMVSKDESEVPNPDISPEKNECGMAGDCA